MRTTTLFVAGVLAVVVGAACGESNQAVASGSTATTGDIASYQQLATNVQDGATTYRANMMAPGTVTTADCQRVHDAYDAQLRPWVSQMVQMSGSMDHYIDDHGGAGVADLGFTRRLARQRTSARIGRRPAGMSTRCSLTAGTCGIVAIR
jgi:hypothetical protein